MEVHLEDVPETAWLISNPVILKLFTSILERKVNSFKDTSIVNKTYFNIVGHPA